MIALGRPLSLALSEHFLILYILFISERYHHKIPPECPPLELKATHGLVTPEEFALPPIDDRWSPSTYSAFDVPPGGDKKSKKKEKEPEQPIEEIVEKPIKDARDQKNESGCSIQ